MVSEKKSATGWSPVSRPAASTRTTPLTRGLPSSAISAAIQPPMEFPTTVTPSSPRSSIIRAYSRASDAMLPRPAGRGVPPKPGWVGTSTLAGPSAASRLAKPSTDWGPAPPCSSRNGRPLPCSVRLTGTGPMPSTVTFSAVVLVPVAIGAAPS